MARKEIIIQLQAYSDAAGKYDPNAPLMGNEDNWFVDDDLSDDIPGRFNAGEDVALSDVGCLMVVADGMGGMNAGEVASQIAIDTVNEYFAPGKITPAMASSHENRREILDRLIKDADKRIKTEARVNPDHAGMGSTIIIAWIVGEEMTLSWCGDSRAYRWNPKFGIEPLSTDHSYVQQLVNQGVITYADTFDHPQGNLVTRSLGDPNNGAKPESRRFDVYQNDVILLCSDGLSGVLRDKKTPNPNGGFYPGENIEELIAANADSMEKCSSELMRAAEQADWYDNVTVLLCKIKEGGKKVPEKVKVRDNEGPGPGLVKAVEAKGVKPQKLYMLVGASVILIGIICSLIYFFVIRDTSDKSAIKLNDIESVDGKIIEGSDVKIDDPKTAVPDGVKAGKDKSKEGRVKPDEKNEEGQDDNSREKGLTEQLAGENGSIVSTKPEPQEGNTTSGELTPTVQEEVIKPKKQETDQKWKNELLSELAGLQVPNELNGYKQRIIEQINSEGSDRESCQKNIKNLKNRITYYNRLIKYNGKIAPTGIPIYNTLMRAITDPKQKYDPAKWEEVFTRLNGHVLDKYKSDFGIN